MVADALFGCVGYGDVHTGIGVFHASPIRVRLLYGRTNFPVVLVREKYLRAAGWVSATPTRFAGNNDLKSPEQSFPAHQPRMHQRVRVGKKALTNLPGLPSVWRNIERHI